MGSIVSMCPSKRRRKAREDNYHLLQCQEKLNGNISIVAAKCLNSPIVQNPFLPMQWYFLQYKLLGTFSIPTKTHPEILLSPPHHRPQAPLTSNPKSKSPNVHPPRETTCPRFAVSTGRSTPQRTPSPQKCPPWLRRSWRPR